MPPSMRHRRLPITTPFPLPQEPGEHEAVGVVLFDLVRLPQRLDGCVGAVMPHEEEGSVWSGW